MFVSYSKRIRKEKEKKKRRGWDGYLKVSKKKRVYGRLKKGDDREKAHNE
jgi:hypothetical protein